MPNNNLFLITMFVQKLSSLKFLDGFIELQIYQSIYKGPISFEISRLLCTALMLTDSLNIFCIDAEYLYIF